MREIGRSREGSWDGNGECDNVLRVIGWLLPQFSQFTRLNVGTLGAIEDSKDSRPDLQLPEGVRH